MKAWLLDRFDGLASLRHAEVPPPEPAGGEAVLRLKFAALNPADRYLAMGQYPAKPPLPHILGRDGVGVVERLGSGVHGLKVGDVRAILRSEIGVERPGTFAELCAVPAEALVPVPSGWSEQQAAAAPLVYLTAFQALSQWGELPPGVVLITGASGGVGVASVQLAKAMGHTVVALSRSQTKRQELTALGADICVDPADADWPRQLKTRLAPRRVDLAVDNIGGELLPQVIQTLGDHGRVSVVGQLAGPVPQFSPASLFFRRLRIGGVAVGAYALVEARGAWRSLLALLDKTGARPLVDSTFAFANLPLAFARLEAGPMGKVLLNVGG